MPKSDYTSGAPELALRVEERQHGMFFWVILAADHGQQVELPELMCYRHYLAAHEPQEIYWNALLLGMAELRRILVSSAATTPSKEITGAAAANERKPRGL